MDTFYGPVVSVLGWVDCISLALLVYQLNIFYHLQQKNVLSSGDCCYSICRACSEKSMKQQRVVSLAANEKSGYSTMHSSSLETKSKQRLRMFSVIIHNFMNLVQAIHQHSSIGLFCVIWNRIQ
jgi:hypothetical protein